MSDNPIMSSEETKRCSQCTEVIEKDAKKCKRCGSVLDKQNKPKMSDLLTKNPMLKVLKYYGYFLGALLAIWLWYISIPIVLLWWINKKSKLNQKAKTITTFVITATFLIVFIIVTYNTGTYNAGNEKMELNIYDPQPQTIFTQETISIKGMVRPIGTKVSILNGETITVDEGGNFNHKLKLEKGMNTITFVLEHNGKTSKKDLVVRRRLSHEEQKEEYRNTLERELKNIQDYKDLSNRDSVADFQVEIAMFSAEASIINDAHSFDDPEIIKLTKQLEQAVSRTQAREFPELRKAYGDMLAKNMWEYDMDIKVFGSSNNIIEFVSAVFASNKNIKEIHQTQIETLQLLRFNQANYKWYKYDNEYTYYKINSDNDDVVKTIE